MTPIAYLPIPATGLNQYAWRRAEIDKKRAELQDPAEVAEIDGVLYWRSNDRPVPMSCFKEAYVVAPAAQATACDASTAAFLATYRAQDHAPSHEDLAEMRANFGAGATLVNVITGKKIQL
jgi:hypothetical protein